MTNPTSEFNIYDKAFTAWNSLCRRMLPGKIGHALNRCVAIRHGFLRCTLLKTTKKHEKNKKTSTKPGKVLTSSQGESSLQKVTTISDSLGFASMKKG